MRMPAQIFQEVENKTGISEEQLRGPSRLRSVTNARRLFTEIALSEGYSSAAIGRRLNKGPTTIRDSKKRIATNSEFKAARKWVDDIADGWSELLGAEDHAAIKTIRALIDKKIGG